MKQILKKGMLVALPLVIVFGNEVLAQSQSLASTMEVYVFPSEGQDAAQQSSDEAACYEWAETNTGTDPFELDKQSGQIDEDTAQQTEQAKQATQGAGARGAVKGAAAGAIIGEIADDDASKGAAYGAAAGAVAARRRGRAASADAQQQAKAQGEEKQAATQEQLGNFKKAFGVCLEAKKYMVKY